MRKPIIENTCPFFVLLTLGCYPGVLLVMFGHPQVSLTGVSKYAEGVAKLFDQEESRCGVAHRLRARAQLLLGCRV